MWYPYYYPYTPFDIYYMLPMIFQFMIIPYYYTIYLELIKAAVESWKKAFESIGKTLTQEK